MQRASTDHRSILMRLFLAWIVCILFNFPVDVQAEQDSVTRVKAVKLEPSTETAVPGWSLAAEFDIALGSKLRQVLDRGVPLRFAVDFQLLRPRWYWTAEEAAASIYTFDLSYNALTRNYRLTSPDHSFSAPSIDDVMQAMSKVNNWQVVRKENIVLGEKYTAHVRFRLVLTELPKPFQISALVNSEWDLSSNWVVFDFIPRREAFK